MSRDRTYVVLGYMNIEGNRGPIGVEHRYSKTQLQRVTDPRKAQEANSSCRPFLGIHLGDMTLALSPIRSSVTHGSSIHRLLHVRLVVRIAWSRRHRSRTLRQALIEVALVECAGERSFLTSACHRWQVRRGVAVQGVVVVGSVRVGRHGTG